MDNCNKAFRISVVLTTYNGENFLSQCLDSVLNQSYKNFEFIIIDDGSTDSTNNIIRLYAKKDQRIRFYVLNHVGPTYALNIGIAKSREKWVARIDQDDIWREDKLEKQVLLLKRNKKIILLGSSSCEIDIAGNFIRRFHYPTSDFFLRRNLMKFKPFFAHSSVIYRTSIFRKIGGYNHLFFMADDWNLWTEFAKRGLISSIDQPLVKIRRHTSQRSFFDGGRLQINHAIASSALLYPFMKNVRGDKFFINWVNSELEKCRYYKKKIDFKKIKKDYISKKIFFKKFFVIFNYLISDFSNFFILFENFFGSALPYKLAKKWKKNK